LEAARGAQLASGEIDSLNEGESAPATPGAGLRPGHRVVHSAAPMRRQCSGPPPRGATIGCEAVISGHGNPGRRPRGSSGFQLFRFPRGPARTSRRSLAAAVRGDLAIWRPGKLRRCQDARFPGCQAARLRGVSATSGPRPGPRASSVAPRRLRSGRVGRARGAGMVASMGAARASLAGAGMRLQRKPTPVLAKASTAQGWRGLSGTRAIDGMRCAIISR
jgi:hypothetical protein